MSDARRFDGCGLHRGLTVACAALSSLLVVSTADARPISASTFASLSLHALGAPVDSITLTPVADNTLYEDPAGAFSNGRGSAMFAGRNSASVNSIRRALLRFDVAAALPAGATVESATLRLSNDAANSVPAMITLHRVTQGWGEGASLATGGQGSGAAAAPGDATWLHRFHPSLNWSAPGGDFAASPSASAMVFGAGFYTWPSGASLVADVQSFLDDPAGNFGWLLRGDETVSSSARRFATREAADTPLRPALTIEFTPVPEPVTGLVLFALLLARWRRPLGPSSRRNDPCHIQSRRVV